MHRLRPICNLLGAVLAAALVGPSVGCATGDPDEIDPFFESSKADGELPKLRQIDRARIAVDEPSDLVVAAGRLYTVSDVHSKIYEVDGDGDVRATIDIEGRDLEALAFDERTGELLVADESRAKIWRIGADGERHDAIELRSAEDGNSGIEGLAFDAAGHLFVAKEKDPARIYELDAAGVELARIEIDFADDLSALAWNPADGHLYALSDRERTLYRLDGDLAPDAAWRLPVEHAEGIAFDGATLYVVSDSEERLYTFELD
ncbi:MAG: SdiA-regulated domain-containing protein [Deltaproteobacteria bacterium]|nr:SdiA-regulated domain-containing protein [Deltaproteobacteria bacterium]